MALVVGFWGGISLLNFESFFHGFLCIESCEMKVGNQLVPIRG